MVAHLINVCHNVDMDIDKMKEMYLSGNSVLKIGKELDIPSSKIYTAFSKDGFILRENKQNSRKYFVDHNFFEKIDNEIKSYWLGYLCADGYITGKDRSRRVGVTSKDIDHMTLFTQDLNSNYPVKVYEATTSYGYTKYGRVLISSDKMYNDLSLHGCVANKSKILLRPNISEDLERHWIRGFLDGDGSLAVSKLAKSGFVIRVLGTEDVILWIKEKIGGGVWFDQVKDIWYLDTTVTLERLEYIYGNSSRSLSRKFDRALLAKQRLLAP